MLNIEALTKIQNYLLTQERSTFDQDRMGLSITTVREVVSVNIVYKIVVEPESCGCVLRSTVLALGIKEFKNSLETDLTDLLGLTHDTYSYIFAVSRYISEIANKNTWFYTSKYDCLDAATRIEYVLYLETLINGV